MKDVKFAAIILCAVFLIVSATGSISAGLINEQGRYEYAPGQGAEYESGQWEGLFNELSGVRGVDINTAMAAFAPDTVMFSAGDSFLSWAELYFFLHDTVDRLLNGIYSVVNWEEEDAAGRTLSEAAKEYSTEQAIHYFICAYAAASLGVSFEDDDLAIFEAEVEVMLAEAGSLEALENGLRNEGFYNLTIFKNLVKLFSYQNLLIDYLYGDDFSGTSDDIAEFYANKEGYMQAKHILLLFPESADSSPEELVEEKSLLFAELEEILDSLREHVNDENILDYFDTLMAAHSEDSGSFGFPEGYLFQSRDMVPQFSNACAALRPGEISEIVESSYGYHIILRLPINADAVPVALAGTAQPYTLRQLAAFDNFDSLYEEWRDSMNIAYTPEYYSIDVSEIFAWRN